jgi:hypothetical protein
MVDKEKREKTALCGRNFVKENFSISAINGILDDIYRSLSIKKNRTCQVGGF